MKKVWITNGFRFSDADVVDCFLNAVNHWFSMEKNSLRNKRPQARITLLNYLRDKTEPQDDPDMIYVLNKFTSEWIECPEAVFAAIRGIPDQKFLLKFNLDELDLLDKALVYFNSCWDLQETNIKICISKILKNYKHSSQEAIEIKKFLEEHDTGQYVGAIGGQFSGKYSPLPNKEMCYTIYDNVKEVSFPDESDFGPYSFKTTGTTLGEILVILDNENNQKVDLTEYSDW